MNTVELLLSSLFAAISGNGVGNWITWPRNTVPFYCDKEFSYEQCLRLRTAAQEIQAHTCINFLEKPFGRQPKWIHVMKKGGCYTNGLGINRHGNNLLSLADGCFQKQTIIHELFHALGVNHMHQRRDRSRYVSVNWEMVPLGFESQFPISGYPNDVNIPYDYSSVMHYDILGGALVPTDSNYSQFLGNARGASFYDYHTVNKLYGCYKNCPQDSFKKCKNGGIPNPRDCSKCNCPSGYTGDFCDRKPPTVKATNSWKKIRLTSPSLPAFSFHKKENILWIQAPHKNKVEVRINQMGMSFNEELQGNCLHYGLEIKSIQDQRLGGPIVCNPNKTKSNHIYRSHSNLLPLIAYNGIKGQQYYEVEYRYV